MSAYKYLGLFFTPTLKWTKAKNTLAAQATTFVSRIFSFQGKFGYFKPKEMFHIFDTMIKPILCYGSEIWGFQVAKEIEAVQHYFCKRYLGVSTSTHNNIALSECGRLPLYTSYYVRCIKYWLKVI